MQRIIPIVYLVRSSQEHLESYSVPPNYVGDAFPTVATSWIKRRQSLSTPADVVFPRRLDHLSRFHRWVDLTLLLNSSKKGVDREFAVLEAADNVFSNIQHSRKPVLIFCGRCTAFDLSQRTFCVQNFFWRAAPSLQPGSERYTAKTLWFSMAVASREV